jgi:hypothetical protein
VPINKKEAEIQAEKILKKVLEDKSHISNILQGLVDKDDSIRYPNAIAAELLSEKNPQLLYPEWDFFVEMMSSKNAFHRSIAIATISNLTVIDKDKKFEDLFDEYFRLLDDKSVIVTRKLAIYVGRIVKAKPSLIFRITKALLGIDDTQHTSSRKDLIKGDIIESLSEFFADIEDKEEIIKFVRNQLSSSSPSTVKKATKFLSKWINS